MHVMEEENKGKVFVSVLKVMVKIFFTSGMCCLEFYC